MFRADKPLGKILSMLADQMLLNILFLLCCLPIVTAGASAITLYEQEYAIWEGRDDRLFRSFLSGIKSNFKKGLALLLIFIAIAAVGLAIWTSALLVGLPVRIAAAVLIILLSGICQWLVGIMGRYEQKVGVTFRNAYMLAFQQLPTTLLLVLVNLGYPALMLILPEQLLSGYLFLLLFIFSAAAACVSTRILLSAFAKIEGKSQPEGEQ